MSTAFRFISKEIPKFAVIMTNASNKKARDFGVRVLLKGRVGSFFMD